MKKDDDQNMTRGEFIIDYIRMKGEEGAFGKEIFDAYRTFLKVEGKPLKSSYDSFRVEISRLKLEGYIEPFKVVPNLNTWPRTYYRLAQKAIEKYG